MKKKIIINIHIAVSIFFAFICTEVIAEDLSYQRVAVETKKKLQIAKNMRFTKQQDQAFWSLYSDYEKELDAIYRDKFDLVQEFKNSNANHTVSDNKANNFIDRFFEIESRTLSTKLHYVEKFKEILPGKKVARFFQIDNKLDAIINHEIAIKINLLE